MRREEIKGLDCGTASDDELVNRLLECAKGEQIIDDFKDLAPEIIFGGASIADRLVGPLINPMGDFKEEVKAEILRRMKGGEREEPRDPLPAEKEEGGGDSVFGSPGGIPVVP